MPLDTSIKIRHYRCFGADEQGFERILPINIIIGKNNSGKTSLIDVIHFVIDSAEVSLGRSGNKEKPEVAISHVILKEHVEAVFAQTTSRKSLGQVNQFALASSVINSRITYTLGEAGRKNKFTWERPMDDANYTKKMEAEFRPPFHGKIFKRINAERDIQPEGSDESKLILLHNGTGATNLVFQIFHHAKHDHTLVKKSLLDELNKIVNPDIHFTDIMARHNGNGVMEMYFEDNQGHLIGLSKMGSGVKTILLVLLNLLVIPEIEGHKKDQLVFGFEELENNLHPSLQRRLFRYLLSYATQYNSHFFITTHSHILIDLFATHEHAQIIHVERKDGRSVAKTITTLLDNRNILKDLDYKASDLMLSNGIVWVEGPSDAIYIELLLDLYQQEIGASAKMSYCIQALSTAIWKYAGFHDFDWNQVTTDIENKIISLAKINHHHLLVIDQDTNYEDLPPEEFHRFAHGTGRNKARLIAESLKFSGQSSDQLETNYGDTTNGQLLFWINDGTIETYLEYFTLHQGHVFGKYFQKGTGDQTFVKRATGKGSAKSKVELATEIAAYCLQKNICFDDLAPADSALRNKIQRLYNTLVSWNS